MKCKAIVLACTISLTGAMTQLAVAEQSGEDGNLEWAVVRNFNLSGKPVAIAHSLDGRHAFVLTEEGTVLVYDKKGELQGKIPAGKGANAITIDPLGQFLHVSNKESNEFSTIALDFVLDIDTADAPTKGAADAPVVVAVFSDFE